MRRACDGCGEFRETEGGLCSRCLIAEVCCQSPQEAAKRLCGCKGGAATTLRRLWERLDRERDARR